MQDRIGTPLDALADAVNAPALKIAIDVGALLSSFSITLAALNAGARVLYSMSRERLFPEVLGRLHPRHLTPHVALGSFVGTLALIAGGMLAAGRAPLDAFNDTATLGAFGFVAIYAFVALGAPVYLKKLGELKANHIVLAVGTLALLIIPAIGSVYPVPPAPTSYFPYVFLAYFLIGTALFWRRSARLSAEGPLAESA